VLPALPPEPLVEGEPLDPPLPPPDLPPVPLADEVSSSPHPWANAMATIVVSNQATVFDFCRRISLSPWTLFAAHAGATRVGGMSDPRLRDPDNRQAERAIFRNNRSGANVPIELATPDRARIARKS
jgi:hypothetical protein